MEEQRKSSLKCMSSVDEQGSFKVHIFFERAPLSTDEQIRPWKSTFPLGEHVSLEKKKSPFFERAKSPPEKHVSLQTSKKGLPLDKQRSFR